MMRTLLSAILAVASMAVLVAPAPAQPTRAYSGAGTTATPGAWLTPTNWAGGVYAGASAAAGGGSATDVGLLNNSATTLGIDMGAAGGTLTLGAINYQYSTPQVLQNATVFSSFVLGNSSAATPGILQLNGAAVNGVANTLIAVNNVSGDGNGVGNNGNDLTIGNTVTGGASTMSLQLGTANGVFNGFGDTHSTRSIFVNVPITQAATNSGFTVQGGGNVTLGGSVANSFTGAVTVAGGQLQVTNANGLRATAATAGTTTVQAGGTLYLNAAITTAENISISGAGYTQTLTSTSYIQTSAQASVYDSQPLATPTFTPVGALRLGTAGVTLNGNITLAGAGATVFVSGGTSTVNGVIGAAGSQSLEKSGPGTLALTNANTYSGGTTITESVVNLTGGGSLATPAITLNNDGTLTLTNSAAANSTTRLGAVTAINLNSGIVNFSHGADAANYSQSAGALTLGSLPGVVTSSQAAAGQTSNLQFASLSPRTGTGSAIFLGVGLGTNNQNTITFTAAPTLDQGGLIGAWALYGTAAAPTDFASYVATPATSSTPGGVVAATANTDTTGATWTAGSNLKFTGGGTIAVPSTGTGTFNGQVNSLNVQTTAATVDLTNLLGVSLRIGSGGILASAGLTIQNGSIVAGQSANTPSELLVSVPAGTSTISANITDNGSAPTAVTVQGAGTLVLSGSLNSFSGPITVNGSNLQLNGAAALGSTTSITLRQLASTLTLGSSQLTLNNTTIPATVTLNLDSFLTGGVNGGLSSGNGAGPGVGANGSNIANNLNNRTTLNTAGTAASDVIAGPIVVSGNNLINFSGVGMTLGTAGSPSTITAGPNGFTGALAFRVPTIVNDTINLPNGVVSFIGATAGTAINSTNNVWAITEIISGVLSLAGDNTLPPNAVLALGQYGTNGNGNTNLSLNGHSQTFNKGIENITTNQNAVIFNGAAGLSILTYNSPGISSVIINQVDDISGATSTTSRLSIIMQAGSLNLDRPNGNPFTGGVLVTGGTLLADGLGTTNPGGGLGPIVVAPASGSVPTVLGGIGLVGGATAGPASPANGGTFANVPAPLDNVTGIRLGAGAILAPGIASIANGNPTTAVYVIPGTPPGATTTANTLAVKSYLTMTGGTAGAGGNSTEWIVGINTGTTGNTGGGTIVNAANLLAVAGAVANPADGSELSFSTTSTNKINIDVEAVNNPVFTPGLTLDYTIATTAAVGSIFLNGSAFPTTPDSTDFTFSSSTISNFAGMNPSLLVNPANTEQLLLQFTPVPEPGSMALLSAAAVGGLACYRRRFGKRLPDREPG
jgi:fibronectin-binding autotransporter adhesin